MNPIDKDPSWVQGRFTITASSAAAEAEWKAFTLRSPEAAKAAFERLSSEPLTRHPKRQFPLRGKQNKPFWEYEATAADRIYYAVDLKKMTVIVAVRDDIHTGAEVSTLIKRRRHAFDASAEETTAQAAKRKRKRSK